MIKACLKTAYFVGNKVFDISDENINRDNFIYFYYKLKEVFRERDVDLSTQDINEPEESDIVIYNGYTKNKKVIKYKNKQYLLMLESPHVNIGHTDTSRHKYFRKIFTWNDDFIDNKKYFKVNYSYLLPNSIPKELDSKTKFCCLIAGNKTTNFSGELYSKRVEAIRWFESNHPDKFDLYGIGWSERSIGRSLIDKVINKVKPLKKLLSVNYPSYKGKVKSKKVTMSLYKFAICYENISGFNGYITEKIFDCFFSGTIPVYWGAKNIQEHIPDNCYIDKRLFKSYESLYQYMLDMPDDIYKQYLDNIEAYLKSTKADQFRAETFANVIVSQILNDTK